MSRQNRKTDEMALEQFQNVPEDQGLSLDELSESFARLLGEGEVPYDADLGEAELPSDDGFVADDRSSDSCVAPAAKSAMPLAGAESCDGRAPDECPVSPENIVEAILFIGHPQDEPISSRHIASLMRGVRAIEVESLIAQLNESYVQHNCPYMIESAATGFRMVLRPKYHGVRERFYGRIREAQLTQAAINTLAIVAYNQPLEKKQIVEMLGKENTGRVLSQLVRRGLVSAVRSDASEDASQQDASNQSKNAPILYQTTHRFLSLFGLKSLLDLPQNHELADG